MAEDTGRLFFITKTLSSQVKTPLPSSVGTPTKRYEERLEKRTQRICNRNAILAAKKGFSIFLKHTKRILNLRGPILERRKNVPL
ncbi:hypothetical protein CH380_17290 [Leptospira adleri]|uniref:Uncharacterized protein n=1 Tax=Leptospira adleri TaxID=2023186 RepID=A0A2M9YKD4_9LEPT|nr:hypothetical protein CH380_17290 [Leptospira adleri]PJZ60775.1 hypothetical protein CH376_16735 [Leptospira adleri]